jgi:hypothetical protein
MTPIKDMNEEQAKEQLRTFLGGRVLTFSVREYDNGEWVAECNEISGIITGGVGDYTERDQLMRDAIVTAAGVDSKFAHLLQYRGMVPKWPVQRFFSDVTARAKYVVPA